jgi:hypothetical protein
MALAYYATLLSPGIAETPEEGFIVARDVVIGRTGFQTYRIGDLPRGAARQFGVDVTNPEAPIDLYRPAEEVFSRETLASFEGKPLCDSHPYDGFVNATNFRQYARGHIQNIRKGDEALEDGEWPLIADLVITDADLITKVKGNVARELSCGYSYSLRREGEKIMQVDIRGNHVAIVSKGRAGSEARINDNRRDRW